MNFEQKLKYELDTRLEYIPNLETIYKNAEKRQDELFKIIFEKCFYFGLFNYISQIKVSNINEIIENFIKIGVLKSNANKEQIASILLDTTQNSTYKINELIKYQYLNNYDFFINRGGLKNF